MSAQQRSGAMRRVEHRRDQAERTALLLTETAVWALSLTVVLSSRRLFDSWSYLPYWLMLLVGSHSVAAVTRRQRWPRWASALTSVAAFVETSALALYDGTLHWEALPTDETLRAVRSDLTDAWHAFGIVEAPTTATAGFLLAGGAAVWTAAFVADTAALRERSPFQALAVPVSLMLFIGALGTEDGEIASAAATLLCIWWLIAAHRTRLRNGWVRAPVGSRRQAIVPVLTALCLGGTAITAGLLVSPFLPGADAAPIVSWKDLDGTAPSPRLTVSPLVDARGRLTGTSSAEMFRVRAQMPSYWRLSALSSFDGSVWGSERRYRAATARLRSPREDERLMTQEFTVGSLSEIWVPAAFEPVSVDGLEALYDADSGTLVTPHGQRTERGQQYTVTSAVELPDIAELSAADAADVPSAIAAQYTVLPEGFSPRIVSQARALTARADGPYESALALQQFFREHFVYSLQVYPGHSAGRLERFVFEERRGYCEQFAGTYAAMARAIGLPSRVAVGFTPGELVDGEYRVRDEHYHAWPEVWIGDRWVYFEPTPGRGAPRATAYTGVAAQQAVPGDPAASSDVQSVPENPADDVAGSVGDLEGFTDVLDTVSSGQASSDWSQWGVVSAAVAAAAAAAAGWVVVVPSWVAARRWRQRRAARGRSRSMIASYWDDAAEALFVHGLERSESETSSEFAQRCDRRLRLGSDELATLAELAQHAEFAPHSPDRSAVETASRCVRDLRKRLARHCSRWERVEHACTTRSLMSGPRSRRARLRRPSPQDQAA